MRILIVDDYPDSARVLGILLQRFGHSVDVLSNGAECLARLESFRPDVLLLDISMPNVSGYDLAKQIRSQPEFSRLALIALSGYADAEHADASLAAGFDDHLAKPANPATLGPAMARAIQRRRQNGAQVASSDN